MVSDQILTDNGMGLISNLTSLPQISLWIRNGLSVIRRSLNLSEFVSFEWTFHNGKGISWWNSGDHDRSLVIRIVFIGVLFGVSNKACQVNTLFIWWIWLDCDGWLFQILWMKYQEREETQTISKKSIIQGSCNSKSTLSNAPSSFLTGPLCHQANLELLSNVVVVVFPVSSLKHWNFKVKEENFTVRWESWFHGNLRSWDSKISRVSLRAWSNPSCFCQLLFLNKEGARICCVAKLLM